MPDLTQQLDERLARLTWLIHRQQRMNAFSSDNPVADPSKGQGRILALLKLRDAVSTKDLSFLLGIRTSSLNEALAKLEKAGLTRREPSESDRRIMLVKLTDKGRAAEQQEVGPSTVYSVLTAQEQAEFLDYLDRVVTALESALEPTAPETYEQMMRVRERLGAEYFERAAGRRRRGPWVDPRAGRSGIDPRIDRRANDDRSGGPPGR